MNSLLDFGLSRLKFKVNVLVMIYHFTFDTSEFVIYENGIEGKGKCQLPLVPKVFICILGADHVAGLNKVVLLLT